MKASVRSSSHVPRQPTPLSPSISSPYGYIRIPYYLLSPTTATSSFSNHRLFSTTAFKASESPLEDHRTSSSTKADSPEPTKQPETLNAPPLDPPDLQEPGPRIPWVVKTLSEEQLRNRRNSTRQGQTKGRSHFKVNLQEKPTSQEYLSTVLERNGGQDLTQGQKARFYKKRAEERRSNPTAALQPIPPQAFDPLRKDNPDSPMTTTPSSPSPVPKENLDSPMTTTPSSPSPLPKENLDSPMTTTPSSPSPSLAHLTSKGTAHMVSITHKSRTHRLARAAATVLFTNEEPLRLLTRDDLPKGDALAVARIGGIMAVKKTPELVLLAHPGLGIESVEVDLSILPATGGVQEDSKVETDTPGGAAWGQFARQLSSPSTSPAAQSDSEKKEKTISAPYGGISIMSTVSCAAKTGIEMEALTSVVIASLNVVDMVKGVDRGVYISDARVIEKRGGKSGAWAYDPENGMIQKDTPKASGSTTNESETVRDTPTPSAAPSPPSHPPPSQTTPPSPATTKASSTSPSPPSPTLAPLPALPSNLDRSSPSPHDSALLYFHDQATSLSTLFASTPVSRRGIRPSRHLRDRSKILRHQYSFVHACLTRLLDGRPWKSKVSSHDTDRVDEKEILRKQVDRARTEIRQQLDMLDPSPARDDPSAAPDTPATSDSEKGLGAGDENLQGAMFLPDDVVRLHGYGSGLSPSPSSSSTSSYEQNQRKNLAHRSLDLRRLRVLLDDFSLLPPTTFTAATSDNALERRFAAQRDLALRARLVERGVYDVETSSLRTLTTSGEEGKGYEVRVDRHGEWEDRIAGLERDAEGEEKVWVSDVYVMYPWILDRVMEGRAEVELELGLGKRVGGIGGGGVGVGLV